MQKRIVIDSANLPFRAPAALTWLLAISMAIWDWPTWLLGILWFMVAVLWVVWILDRWKNETRRVFEKPPSEDR